MLKRNKRLITAMMVATIITGTMAISTNALTKEAFKETLNTKLSLLDEMKAKKSYNGFRQLAEEIAQTINEANKVGAITNERANTLMEDLVKFSKAYNKHEYLQKHGKEILEKHNAEEAKRQADYMAKLALGVTKPSNKDSETVKLVAKSEAKSNVVDKSALEKKLNDKIQAFNDMKSKKKYPNFRQFAEEFAAAITEANKAGVIINDRANTLMEDLVKFSEVYNKHEYLVKNGAKILEKHNAEEAKKAKEYMEKLALGVTKPSKKDSETVKSLEVKEVLTVLKPDKKVEIKKADKLVKTGSTTTTEGLMAIGAMVSAVGAFLMRRFRK